MFVEKGRADDSSPPDDLKKIKIKKYYGKIYKKDTSSYFRITCSTFMHKLVFSVNLDRCMLFHHTKCPFAKKTKQTKTNKKT